MFMGKTLYMYLFNLFLPADLFNINPLQSDQQKILIYRPVNTLLRKFCRVDGLKR